MVSLGLLLRVLSGFNQDVGRAWVLIGGSTKEVVHFQTQVVGRSDFLAALGLRVSISCWLSSGGHPQILPPVGHSLFSMWTSPNIKTCFIHLERRRKSPGKMNVHLIMYIILPLPYSPWLEASIQSVLRGEGHTRCERQSLGPTLRDLHNNLVFTEKILTIA